jgi:hypothetical protein
MPHFPRGTDEQWQAAMEEAADRIVGRESPVVQRTFTTELAVRLLDVKHHRHGKRGPTYITYSDALRVARQLCRERGIDVQGETSERNDDHDHEHHDEAEEDREQQAPTGR